MGDLRRQTLGPQKARRQAKALGPPRKGKERTQAGAQTLAGAQMQAGAQTQAGPKAVDITVSATSLAIPMSPRYCQVHITLCNQRQ